MSTLTTSLLPLKLTTGKESSAFVYRSRRRQSKKSQSIVPVARLFGPSIFEASKLKVLFLGVDEKKHPGKLPRRYTLTHSDITCDLTLAVSQTINNSQLEGWYNRLQRDEVVAEWKKVKGKMSLHVHCHISGGHFLLDFVARLRYYIFCKELPVVLKAFVHGDGNLLKNYPELQDALVWVYFHSNISEFNKVDCWGPLKEASSLSSTTTTTTTTTSSSELGEIQMANTTTTSNYSLDLPQPCKGSCTCCFPSMSLISWSSSSSNLSRPKLEQ
ncbi:protein STAY-GREEN homolog, chloroplastic-like [Lycium barbarum]|uniref:protein STAY-GREEN homolog, chloroplastic-like n=1 Tax=Lycium barbarum TaxID=112863 RepID=UPI00293EAB8C|nr:protein STAY-GREEN homolog, chloroplastic-like [Lycium barbarum]